MKNWVLLLCFSMSLFTARAQYVQHFAERQGLSNRIVHHALSTSDGYLWVATSNGLNRFNGYEFLNLNRANTPRLYSDFITYLFEDASNNLWVATDNGIHVLNLRNHKIIEVFQHQQTPGSLSNNYVLQIYQSHDKKIWVSTVDGILHQYLGNGKFKQIRNQFSKDGVFGYRLKIVDYKNSLWIKTLDKGVFRLNLSTGKVISNYLMDSKSYNESGISVLPEYGLVAMVKDGVRVYNPDKDEFKPITFNSIKNIFSMLNDEMGNIWITGNERKTLLRLSNEKVEDITPHLFDFSENVHINAISFGKGNDVWICTNNGLFKFINERPFFSSILTKSQLKKALYVPSFRGMLQTQNGDVFVGGYGGLFRLRDGRLTQLLDNKIPWSPSKLIDKDKDFLWMICEGYGLNLVNKHTGEVIKHQRNISKHNYLYTGVLEQNGTLLLGGYDELVWYNPKINEYTDCKLIYKGKYYSRPSVRFIFRSVQDELWVCTSHGVFVFDKNRKIRIRYAEDEPWPYKIKVNQVFHISEDFQQLLWLSSNGGGVICINQNGNVIKHITTENGLADNQVAFCINDSSNKLWVGTFNGLSMINQSNEISNFYQEHGLSSNEFNSASILYRKDGTIMMGTIDGINLFNGVQLKSVNKHKSNKVVISSLEVLDQHDEIKQYYCAEDVDRGVKLSYKSSYLTISFFNTDFRHADKNVFFYKLEGLNDNWISLGEKNYIRFASLTPGAYVLRIKGISSGNTQEAEEAKLSIEMPEVFYKRIWFIALVVLFVLLIISWAVYIKVQRIKDVLLVRTKISNDLHDNVGSVLTRVAMQAELLQDEVDTEQKEILYRIIKTCRMAMSNMRDVIWSTDTRYNSIGNLFDKITEMVQQTMEQSPIVYKLNYDKEVKKLKINQEQKQEIFFIMKEAFHNILKHANGDVAELHAYKVKNQLVFTLYNNGEVLKKQLQTSSGLNNMQMRAARIKANFSIDTADGFMIKLAIPLRKRLFIF